MGSRLARMLGDIIALHAAFVLAFLLRFGGGLPAFNFESYLRVAPWLTIVVLILGNLYGLYGRERLSRAELRLSLIVVTLLGGLATAGLSFLVRGLTLPRTVLLLAQPLQFLFALGCHHLIRAVTRRHTAERLLVLGGRERVGRIETALRAFGGTEGGSVQWALPQTNSELLALVERHHPTLVLVTTDLSPPLKEAAMEIGLSHELRVYLVPALYEVVLHGSRLTALGDLPVLALDWPAEDPVSRFIKRLVDVILAAAGLLVGAPLLLAVALLVLLTTGRPVFYTQQRVGRGGRPFTLIKFRTMAVDAEAATGPVLSTGQDDPRVTRLGRLLRRTRLDELPQLINVLIGEMSVVGPRPERPVFVSDYVGSIPGYQHRHRMKPGLTGLAQVEGRYSTPAADKLRFDLLYARTCNVWADLRIILRTARTILMGSKAS